MTSRYSSDTEGSMRAQLRALDPDLEPIAAEHFERAVMGRVLASGDAPSVPSDPLYGLWSLPRPVLLAASMLALAVLGISVTQRPHARAAPATIAESMGVPPQLLATSPPR